MYGPHWMGAPFCSVCPSQDVLPVSSPCPAVFQYWFLFSEQQLRFEVLSSPIGYAVYSLLYLICSSSIYPHVFLYHALYCHALLYHALYYYQLYFLYLPIYASSAAPTYRNIFIYPLYIIISMHTIISHCNDSK